ncbi:ADP-ribosyltransferase [Mycobacterium phage Onyinye]|uniref:ADP-ribosyltransferase n=1 Tax=Mycobacterium phage Onyinye TaxID=2686235 RepID=A0A6B9L6W7_9CAUD|nr:ADP-ribosyltransferase [Mycobacterium phage Onyinye]QHB37422.1 ADP-ribosyltransferase [Mycobacterium phage Onyinye]
MALANHFDESKVKRDNDGKFAKKAGIPNLKGLGLPTWLSSIKGKQPPKSFKFYKPGYTPKAKSTIKGDNASADGMTLWNMKKLGAFDNDYEFWLAAGKLASAYKKNHPNTAATPHSIVNMAFHHEIDETKQPPKMGSPKAYGQKVGTTDVPNATNAPSKPKKTVASTPSGLNVVSGKYQAPGDLTPTGKKMPGVNGALVYKDGKGQNWLVKFPGGSKGTSKAYSNSLFLVDLDVATSRIQSKAGLPVPSIHAKTVDGKTASVHKMYSRVADAFPDNNPNLKLMDEADVREIQKNMVLDWLLSNHDPHTGNFLKTDKGIIGIDKGQSFKYFGKDKLTTAFGSDLNPPLAPNKPVYSTVMQQHKQGQGELFSFENDPELRKTIDRIMGIDDEEYKKLLRPYAEKARKQGLLNYPGKSYSDSDEQAVEKFLQAATDRKNNLLKDFQGLDKQLGFDKEDEKLSAPAGIENPGPGNKIHAPGSPVIKMSDLSVGDKIHFQEVTMDGAVWTPGTVIEKKNGSVKVKDGLVGSTIELYGDSFIEDELGEFPVVWYDPANADMPTAYDSIPEGTLKMTDVGVGDTVKYGKLNLEITEPLLSQTGDQIGWKSVNLETGKKGPSLYNVLFQEDKVKKVGKPKASKKIDGAPGSGIPVIDMKDLQVGDELHFKEDDGPYGVYWGKVEVIAVNDDSVTLKDLQQEGVDFDVNQDAFDNGLVVWDKAPTGNALYNEADEAAFDAGISAAKGEMPKKIKIPGEQASFEGAAVGDVVEKDGWTYTLDHKTMNAMGGFFTATNGAKIQAADFKTGKITWGKKSGGSPAAPNPLGVPEGYKIVPHPTETGKFAIQKPNGMYSKTKDDATVKSWATEDAAANSSTMAKYKNQTEAQKQAELNAAKNQLQYAIKEATDAPENDPNTQLKGIEGLEYAELKQKIIAGNHTPDDYVKFKTLKSKLLNFKKAEGAAQVEEDFDGGFVAAAPTPSTAAMKKGGFKETPKFKLKGGAPPDLSQSAKGPNAITLGQKLWEMKKSGHITDDFQMWKEAAKLAAADKKQALAKNPNAVVGVDYSSKNSLRNVAMRLEFDETGDVAWSSAEELTSGEVGQTVAQVKKSLTLQDHKPVVPASSKNYHSPHFAQFGNNFDPLAPVGSYKNPHAFKYGDTQAVNAYGYKYTDHNNWDPGQKSAWYAFSGSSSGQINTYFRTGSVGLYGNEEQVKKQAQNIVAAYKSKNVKRLDDWTAVVRGTSGGWELGIGSDTVSFEEMKAMEGKVVRNKCPVSTSLRDKPPWGSYRITYKLPPGFPMLALLGKSAHPGEQEVLLPPGMAYRIVEVKKGTSGYQHEVLVEVVDVKLPEVK